MNQTIKFIALEKKAQGLKEHFGDNIKITYKPEHDTASHKFYDVEVSEEYSKSQEFFGGVFLVGYLQGIDEMHRISTSINSKNSETNQPSSHDKD